MAYYDLEGVLVSDIDAKPIKNIHNIQDVIRMTSQTIEERLEALNFEKRQIDSTTSFSISKPILSSDINTLKGQQTYTILLPSQPAGFGLWANDLVKYAHIDFCSMLPQITHCLLLPRRRVVLCHPIFNTSQKKSTSEVLEIYTDYLVKISRELIKLSDESEGKCKFEIIAYGFGSHALILALSSYDQFLERIHKMAFIQCKEMVSKALSNTLKMSDEKNIANYASNLIKTLERRSIMFELSEKPIGQILTEVKDSICACPILSMGTSDPKHVTLDAGMLAVLFFSQKDTPSIMGNKMAMFGIIAIFMVLLATIIMTFIL